MQDSSFSMNITDLQLCPKCVLLLLLFCFVLRTAISLYTTSFFFFGGGGGEVTCIGLQYMLRFSMNFSTLTYEAGF